MRSSIPKNVDRSARIIATAGVCGGQPRIAGTRIPISVLLRCRALGYSDARVLEGYPSLTKKDLAAAWTYVERSWHLAPNA
jgi:uncharacterized protein (DUF433 family)